jgi:hypothetical protein
VGQASWLVAAGVQPALAVSAKPRACSVSCQSPLSLLSPRSYYHQDGWAELWHYRHRSNGHVRSERRKAVETGTSFGGWAQIRSAGSSTFALARRGRSTTRCLTRRKAKGAAKWFGMAAFGKSLEPLGVGLLPIGEERIRGVLKGGEFRGGRRSRLSLPLQVIAGGSSRGGACVRRTPPASANTDGRAVFARNRHGANDNRAGHADDVSGLPNRFATNALFSGIDVTPGSRAGR